MPSVHASFAVAALAGVLALASAAGSSALVGGVALLIVFFALGAVRAAGIPAARWAGGVALLAGAGALGWTYVDRTSDLTPMSALLAPTIAAAVVVQLLRHDGRGGLTSSLTVTVTSCVLAVLPVSWVALREAVDGAHSVGLALLGVGAVGLMDALPLSRAVRRVVGVLVAAVAAGVLVMTVEQIADAVPAVSAVVVTAFAGVMAAIAFAVADRLAEETTSSPATVPDGDAEAVVYSAGAVAGDEARVSQADGEADREPSARGAEAGEPSESSQSTPAVTGAVRATGIAALLPLRVTLPFVAAAPAAYVLGRIFVG